MNTLQAKPIEEWIVLGKKNFKQYIFYDGYCLDLTQFKYMHPGGAQVIKNYLFKDVTQILFTVFPHNQHTTPKILERYRIGVLNQPPVQRLKKQGTILKQRKDERENSLMKKSVQFPSEVKKLASQKQLKQQMKRSKVKNTKSKMKNSISVNINNAQQKKLKRTKNLNQEYLQALKGSKTHTKPTKSVQKLAIHQDEIKQQLTITKFDSGQMQQNVKQNTLNVSIKKYMKQSWGTLQDFVEETVHVIRVPIFNVRMDRIW